MLLVPDKVKVDNTIAHQDKVDHTMIKMIIIPINKPITYFFKKSRK